ncbi:MAG: hypothetical protein MRQ13_05205, partial [Candidatus Midichloria sp.]|nr:hypothetical protein [Candidatus Midichloria sp.]
ILNIKYARVARKFSDLLIMRSNLYPQFKVILKRIPDMVLKEQGNHSLNFMTNKKDNFIIEL